MTEELDAEEVECLALVPVHAGEDAFGGGHLRRRLRHVQSPQDGG